MALRNTTGGAYSAASVRNNNGTIVKAGNVSSDGPITKVLGLNDLADDKGEAIGSKADYGTISQGNTGDKAGVQKAVSAGTLAFNASATQWVMQGGNVSTTIGGVANTSLVGGARDYSGQVNDDATAAAALTISDRRVGTYSSQGFNVLAAPSTNINPNRSGSGTDGRGTGAGSASTYIDPVDGGSTTVADIKDTRSVPGELTYHFGALAAPTTDEYKASDTLES